MTVGVMFGPSRCTQVKGLVVVAVGPTRKTTILDSGAAGWLASKLLAGGVKGLERAAVGPTRKTTILDSGAAGWLAGRLLAGGV